MSALALLLLLPLLQLAAIGGQALGDVIRTDATAERIDTRASGDDFISPLRVDATTWSATVTGAGAVVSTASGASVLRTSTIAGVATDVVEPVQQGGLVTFDHGIATEWWRESSAGLEQGWTFASEPVGADGTLTVDVAIDGALTPMLYSPTSVVLLGEDQPLWYSGLTSWDATGRELPSEMTVTNASTVTVVVDAAHAVYPVTIDPTLTEAQKIEPPNGTAQDNTGAAVAIDGPNAAVSIPGEDVVGRNAGRVVFYRDNGAGGWAFSQATNGGLGSDAGYGNAVAIASDPTVDPDPGTLPDYDRAIALIGAPGSDLNGTDSGAVEVYSYDPAIPGGWQFVTNIFACDDIAPNCDIDNSPANIADQPGAAFGTSIDLQYLGGSTWLSAIGAPGIDQVHYIQFDMTLSGRTIATGFDADLREILTGPAGEGFGRDVDMRWGPNDVLDLPLNPLTQYYVVGTGTDAFPGTDTAAAYIYRRQPAGAPPVLVETIPDTGIGHGRVAVANDVVAVGDDARFNAGGVRIFINAFNGAEPMTEATTLNMADVPPEESAGTGKFGAAIELAAVNSENAVLVAGVPGVNRAPSDPDRTGIAYSFGINVVDVSGVQVFGGETKLPEEADPTTPAEQRGAAMGTAIATDGVNWIVGAPLASEIVGGVGQSTRDGEAQIGPIRAAGVTDLTIDDGPPAALGRLANPQLDRFGSSIDIDGDRMVIGAPDRDSTWEKGGAVFVYDRDGFGVWNLSATINALGPPIGFDPVEGFGTSVGVEGDFIIVGGLDAAPFFPIYAYQLVAGAWELVDVAVNGGVPDGFGGTVAILTHPGTGNVTAYVGGSDSVPADSVDGQVRVFEFDGVEFAELASIAGTDAFGSSLDAAADVANGTVVVAVGSLGDKVDRYVDQGGGTVVSDGSYSDVAPDFGRAVAIDPTTLNIAALGSDKAVLLKYDAGALTVAQEQPITAFDAAFGDLANRQVAVQDDYLLAPKGGSGLAVAALEPDGGGYIEIDDLVSVDSTTGDQLGWATVWTTDGTVALGAPGDDGPVSNIEPEAGAVYVYSYAPPVIVDDPTLNFTFDLAPGSAPTVGIAPSGVAATEFDAATLEAAAESDTSIAASPLGAVELEYAPLGAVEIAGSPLGAVAFGDPLLGLADIIANTPSLAGIPLVEVGLAGGWESVIAGTPLADQPINNLTLGDVLTNAAANANLAATPLGAVEIAGTPLGAVPLGAVALGTTPLGAVPLGAVGVSTDAEFCALLDLDPLVNCTDYLDNTSALEASLRGAPLGAVPLGAVPLGAVDVGATPLGAVPLGAVDLAQSPLGAVPLGAVNLAGTPLGAVPLGAVPLGAVPLGAVDVAGLPLGAVPLGAVELDAVDATGAPLGAVPLGAVPLGAVSVNGAPLGAVPLGAVNLGSTPLGAVPLGAVPLGAVPLGAVALADAPLGAVPLGAVAANTAANEQAWCDLLDEIGGGYDCTIVDPSTNTLLDIMIQGVPLGAVPLGAVPLGAVPLGAVDLAGTPLGAVPLGAVPLGAVPLGAVPLGAVDLTGTPLGAVPTVGAPLGAVPLGAVPLGAVDIAGSPLGAVPLGAVPLGAVPLGAVPLGAVPLGAVPLGAVPLGAVNLLSSPLGAVPLGAVPLGAVDITGSPLGAVPLGAVPLGAVGFIDCTMVDCDVDTLADAITAGAADALLLQDLSILEGSFAGIRFSEILAAVGITAADVDFGALTLGSPSFDPSEMVLGDLPSDIVELDTTTLADIEAALWAVTYADLIGALPASEANTESGLDAALAAYGTASGFTLEDFQVLGDVSIDDLTADGSTGLQLQDFEAILGLLHVQAVLDFFGADAQLYPGPPPLTFGDLNSYALEDLTVAQLGDLTLFDLIGIVDFGTITLEGLYDILLASGALDGYTFGDLLVALVAADELPFEGLDFTEVEVGELPTSIVAPVSFAADVEITDSTEDHAVEVSVDLPGTASYVAGSGSIGDPVVDGNRLSWTITDLPANTPTSITFDVRPAVSLGVTELDASARILGFTDTAAGIASVAVGEGLEPNDYPATTLASENTIYLTYIASATDDDVFEINVAENDQLAVSLTSLTSDLDIALYVDPTDDAASIALSGVSDEAPLVPITDPDQEGADSEPLQDFRRLDLEDTDLELVEVSNSAGVESELIVTERLIQGTYYIQVFGANGATNVEPAALQIQILEAESAPTCVAQGPPSVAAPASAPVSLAGSPNTAILVNYQRFEELYDGTTRADVQTAIDDFVTYVNGNAALGVDAVAIPIDSFADVRTAYSDWDNPANAAEACDPLVANAVVDAIIENAIDPIRDSLEHIMVIGSDQMIPMARLADQTTVANEYDFRHEFDDDATSGPGTINALTSTFWERTYLSDEPYGETAARDIGDRFLYVSDVGLGRLVESPAQIIGQLDHFENFAGLLNIQTGQVLGYDFLSDGSAEISADLAAGLTSVDDSLADGEISPGVPWTATEAVNSLTANAGTPADIVSLNAHFDHYRALPADEGVLLETSNVLTGIEVDIVFSMGCHGGLNVSDLQVANTNQDWAETFADNQTVFIGNTGFGYGDTETVAYTERLLALFAEEVVRPFETTDGTKTTIGQALTYAKNRYVSDVAAFSVYDEKAVMESTFYGIPFYTVGIAGDPLPAAPDNTTAPDATGLETLSENITATNTPEVTSSGTFYSNPDVDGGDPQVISVPGYPVQPSLSSDVSVVVEPDTTVLDQIAHGAVVTGMTSEYLPGVDPVVSGAIYDEVAAAQGEPELGDVVFPAKPVSINTATTPAGERQTLVVATGQFASTGAVQRLDSDIDVVIYYADPSQTDFIAPTVGTVDSALENGQFTVTLDVTDAAGVERVLVLADENPGAPGAHIWVPIELQAIAGTDQWSGSTSVTAGTTEVEFLVQAVDGFGNVGFATNKARNFNDDGQVEPEPPTPDLDAGANPANLDVGTGWYTGDATIDVTVENGAAEYSVDGSAFAPVSGTGFVISGDGIHSYEVRLTSLEQSISGLVRIDTTGAPIIEIAPPADGAVYPDDSSLGLSYLCSDPSLQVCSATIDGAAASLNDPLPVTAGAHVVTVSATDVFGNAATLTHTYTIQAQSAPPVIIDAMVENIAAPGETTEVWVEFSGDPGVTVSIDWGDGTVTSGTVTDPTATEPGTAEASHTYGAGGVYDITITLTSPAGATASTMLTTASCTKTGTSGNDYIVGTTGDDVLCGLGGNDKIYGLAGNDIIFGGGGRDTLYGNSGADIIFGGNLRDIIYGGGQDDILIGGAGNDYMNGQSGNDILRGRSGPDALIGGGGNDEMYGQAGNDYISGQSGNDYARGGAGDDRMYGSGGTDELRGNAGNDIIAGGGGDDILAGGSGDDKLYGQTHDDQLNGGADTDLCRGGGGANTLVNCEA